jgi:hypothetical protein
MLSPTWKHFFATRASNAAGNANPNAYLTAWSDTVDPETKLQLLTNDPSMAILAGDTNNGIMILHSFKNLGGTVLSPADCFVCLVGPNRLASIIHANEVAISENCSITTPSADDIIACNDLEELLNLGTPLAENEEDTTYAGGNTFLPPLGPRCCHRSPHRRSLQTHPRSKQQCNSLQQRTTSTERKLHPQHGTYPQPFRHMGVGSQEKSHCTYHLLH